MIPFAGIEIREEKSLAGHKHAIQFGDGPVRVSPAMWKLLKGAADGRELRLLLENIKVQRLPALPDPRRLGEFRLYGEPRAYS